ncbi:MAG: hypothetical protein A2687_05005 [Candidatus Levybacteria bacterium RIFCSPHIGHO2_01_FULL_38_26]|nr:MAG: hypothetical protein A2687_05005 [Candidatus Levybacteria bacterium RIFCSPHIGHO2_01_FULL_38_26]
MFYSKVSADKYLIRLLKGEEINESVKKFCEKLDVKNAGIVGIGSVENPSLAHYRVDTKKYKEKTFKGIFELTSLVGSVAIFEGKPLVHNHVTISDEDMNVLGGHLVSGVVSATVEIVLTVFDSSHTKSHDEEIGLKLWNLPESL